MTFFPTDDAFHALAQSAKGLTFKIEFTVIYTNNHSQLAQKIES